MSKCYTPTPHSKILICFGHTEFMRFSNLNRLICLVRKLPYKIEFNWALVVGKSRTEHSLEGEIDYVYSILQYAQSFENLC